MTGPGHPGSAWHVAGTSWMNDWINEWMFTFIQFNIQWMLTFLWSFLEMCFSFLFSIFFFLTQSLLEGPCAAICIYFPVFDHDLSFLIRTDFSCSVGILFLDMIVSPHPSWDSSFLVFVHNMTYIGSELFEICTGLFLAFMNSNFFWHLLGTTVGEISWILSSLLLRNSCV